MNSLPAVYLITDRHKHAPGLTFLETVEELLSSGLKLVQLREKDLSAAELYPLALRLRELTHKYSARLVINDRIDIALAVVADGVHLGGHSLPVPAAREVCKDKLLIGVSTHSPDEISTAAAQGADFVTYGPIFATESKAKLGEPVGPTSLKKITAQIPVYPLGGIKLSNIDMICANGYLRIAAISALLEADNPKRQLANFLRQLHK